MGKNNLDKYYEHQVDYFTKDFAPLSKYKLLAWHTSYIDRIKHYLLKKNYSGKKLLDIGSGEGYVSVEMAKLGLYIIAVDLTKAALDNLHNYFKDLNIKKYKLIQCNAEKIPLPSASVDYITANAILEHMPHEKKTVQEWKRLLKPGGRMMITVPLHFKYVWPFLWPINYIHDQRIGHLRRYYLEDLQAKFDMKVVKHYYTGHLIKVIGFLIMYFIFRTSQFDDFFEKVDRWQEGRRYGASNIIVIFEK